MKKLVFSSFLFILSVMLTAQESLENKIRDLEQKEVEAVLKKDIVTLKKIWKEDVMVNNPYNTIILDREDILSRFGSGIINYSSFTRTIEEMRIIEGMVITMGIETLTHAENNRKVKRRFTNIWMKHEGEWMMSVRHANIICE